MKNLLLVFGVALSLFGQSATTVIDCGSATDSNFTGGAAFTIANPPRGVTDATLRYGASFAYSIPVQPGVPYVLAFHFVEPCGAGSCSAGDVTGPGQRIFSVAVNDQIVLPNLDLWAVSLEPPGTAGSALVPLVRSVIVMPGTAPAGAVLNIVFTGSIRTAVVSEIDITQLFQVFGGQASAAAWPVINAKCTRCHGNDLVPGDTHLVDGLDLRTRTAMLAGGGMGTALVPGKPASSLMYQAITRPAPCLDVQQGGGCNKPVSGAALTTLMSWPAPGMPPSGPLQQSEIAAIKTWIALGAP